MELPPVFALQQLGVDTWLLTGLGGPWGGWWRLVIGDLGTKLVLRSRR